MAKTHTRSKKPVSKPRTPVRHSGPPESKHVYGPLPHETVPPLTTETLAEMTTMSEAATAAPAPPEIIPAAAALKPATASRWKLEERVPLRSESLEEESARYPKRMARWEAAKAMAESRKGHEEEDQQHRQTCEVRKGCEHPSHVPPRRELREETIRDRRHLGSCLLEDPECLDDSHLLPPHPLEAAQEYCCEHKCFPRWEVRYLTECPYIPVPVRERRQRELRRFGKKAFIVQGG